MRAEPASRRASVCRRTPTFGMPSHHELRNAELSEKALDQLQRASEYQPDSYEELVELDGIGPGSLRALAMIAELVHDAESSRDDPAKYVYAHGAEDGPPHPVERERYDRSVEYMRSMLEGAELDRETKQETFDGLAELEDQATGQSDTGRIEYHHSGRVGTGER
ncbi:DUF763 domain-containing protein [Haloarculaceae archaeon H-GB11]|nr:DUF763 domain-containing protein [Haloarculaceae archaeon H-GB11]